MSEYTEVVIEQAMAYAVRMTEGMSGKERIATQMILVQSYIQVHNTEQLTACLDNLGIAISNSRS